ncbi:hypothetical protein AB832_07175 [Flavobacteriaceae bacterium (ex Bugula neritina AB1)]|nr:hypothetical protein AB832_07175 [Flavobacteriaceae bacterium (ex Bugula neritina AB1)]
MSRVTDNEVRGIITTSLADLSTFRNTASRLVESKLDSSGLDEALLKDIEMYLTAHLITLSNGIIESEKLGDASVSYKVPNCNLLMSTYFGQIASSLDPTGILQNMGKKSIIFKGGVCSH